MELAPGLTEVTFFGGCPLYDPKMSTDEQPNLAETIVMTFGELTDDIISTHTTTYKFKYVYMWQFLLLIKCLSGKIISVLSMSRVMNIKSEKKGHQNYILP